MSQTTAGTPAPAVTVGVLKETAPGEQRVAIVPESVPVLARTGVQVLVESGAGAAACFTDQAYQQAGARILSRGETAARADVLVGVSVPAPDLIAGLRARQAVIGLLRPLVQPELARQLAGLGVTTISLDGLPRTVSRAQSMDALTSQANVAGYKAVLVAADNFGRFFPMLITAAGTSQARQRARARRRRGRAAGHGHGPQAGRHGNRLRHPARDPGPDRIGRRQVPPARIGGPDGRRGRLRACPHRRGAGGPASGTLGADRPLRTSSSPPRRCRAAARRCWSPRRPSRACRPARYSSTWPPAAWAGTSRARWPIRRS